MQAKSLSGNSSVDELVFESWLLESRIKHIRYMMVLTLLLYILYAYVESLMQLDRMAERLALHGILIPTFLAVAYSLSYLPRYRFFMRLFLMSAPVVAVSSNLYLNLGFGSFSSFAPEIYLNIIWTFTMSGLTLRYSAIAVACSVMISIIMTFIRDFSVNGIYLHFLWLLSSVVFGVLTSIILEKLHRSLFDQQQQLMHSATTDSLTGLWNREKLINQFNDEFYTAHQPINYSVLMLDLDYFKSVNDNFGHIVGDKVLIQFARIVRNHVNSLGYVGRFGGEEFCVLLPDFNVEQAGQFAQTLLTAVSEFKFDEVGVQTVSIGVSHGYSGEKFEAVISRADSALYKAKESGRNNVQLYEHNSSFQIEVSALV